MGVAASHPPKLLAAFLAGALALALSVGTATAQASTDESPAAGGVGERGLLANGDFGEGLDGWAAYRARLSLVRRGPRGTAVRVSPKHPGGFLIFRAPRPVRSTSAATLYLARAWARPSRRGQRVCLRVQQVVAGRVVRKNRSCFSSRGRWRLAQLRFRAAACTNGQVGVSLTSRGAAFEVDAITLAEAPAPNLSVRAPSLCQKPKKPPAPEPAPAPAPAPSPAPAPAPAPAPEPTPAPTPTPTAPRDTALSYQDPFPAGSMWKSPLPADPALDSGSAEKIAYWLTQIRWPNLGLRQFSTAVAVASPTSPTYTISCTIYVCPDMNQFGPVPIPAGTRPDPSSDGHLAVWDPVNRREWDFWISGCPTACQQTGGGGSFTHSLVPWVPFSANAAGWPLLAGIVHPEEIAAGRIDHPLVFASPNVGVGHVCPANHSDGRNADSRALKEGTLVQLDPSVDVDALPVPAWQKTLARAMQQYGMYLVDGGGSFSIRTENPINRGDLWGALGLMGDSVLFETNFPWHKMRVLAPPKPWC